MGKMAMPPLFFERMGDDQFERLISQLCTVIFGNAAEPFTKGRDKGIDTRFEGTANSFPSEMEPWKGKVIIQAKHTSRCNAAFADKNFFSPNSTTATLSEVVSDVKELRKEGNLDYYVLVSNRTLTPSYREKIVAYISEQGNLPEENIRIICINGLRQLLAKYPEVVEQADIDPISFPFWSVEPHEFSIVIEEIAKYTTSINQAIELAEEVTIKRVKLEEKNEINNMTHEFSQELCRKYIKKTQNIKNILADPINEEIEKKYSEIAFDLNLKILSQRKDFQTFDKVMMYVLDTLMQNVVLKEHKDLTRLILFYMYWNCDLGKKTKEEENGLDS